FKKVKRSENQLVECIISSVRFKLMTCLFKKSRDSLAILRQWKLSEMEWRNRSGNIVPFSVNDVWNSIRPMAAKVDWFRELMHNYHLDRGVPRCTFKVDIQKAYDTVDWNFLQRILVRFGFHKRMVTWIMECVTTTSFSISINGSLHGYFKGKRGLRQGDPLSPYLFTMVMEILTLMLKRSVRDSDLFTYHRYCSKMELINLCFADDLFLFAHGDPDSASVIMEALDEFKLASGLVPSLTSNSKVSDLLLEGTLVWPP
nr:putative reverse transcriptase domain, reverse transcriptase zinc-binding domain protein [Tanacetum cinerariifolium]